MTKLNNDNDLVRRGEMRDALMQKAKPLIGGGVAVFVIDDYNKAVDGVQSVDARPVVYGDWIRRQSWSEGGGMGASYGFYWECSNCGRQTKGDYSECGCKFCSNCGADMNGHPYTRNTAEFDVLMHEKRVIPADIRERSENE